MTLFILFNHTISPEQTREATETLGVTNIVVLSDSGWASIDPHAETLMQSVAPYQAALAAQAVAGDYLFVQGEFGATYAMVRFALTLGVKPIYATTERRAAERFEGGKLITTHVFEHVRFRAYE